MAAFTCFHIEPGHVALGGVTANPLDHWEGSTTATSTPQVPTTRSKRTEADVEARRANRGHGKRLVRRLIRRSQPSASTDSIRIRG